MLHAYPYYLKRAYLLWIFNTGNRVPNSSYSRTAFNEYGDIVYKPLEGQMDVNEFFAKNHVEVPAINDICVNRLNELNEYCIERGAYMVVAGYPIAYGQYAKFSEEDFKNFQEQFESVLDCDVISDYTDYFYPYDYFYDTVLHLTEKGTQIRTKQLINDLKNWFDMGNY